MLLVIVHSKRIHKPAVYYYYGSNLDLILELESKNDLA